MNRVVIKIGTHTLLGKKGQIDNGLIKAYAKEIKNLRGEGIEVILVSSGAVAQGRFLLKNAATSQKNAHAAVGQANLISFYASAFARHSLAVGQLLLGQRDIANKDTYIAFQRTINELLGIGVIPIINENDAVTNGTSATFMDNDNLSVAVALTIKADMIIILSHVNGLYTDDPEKNLKSKLVHNVSNTTKEFLKFCDRTTSTQGSGGMMAKLKAIRIASAFGIAVVIANGRRAHVLTETAKGQSVGTLFVSHSSGRPLKNRDRWILSAKISSGSLVIDKGAVAALRRGKSLLAVGVIKVYGSFKKGEVIEVLNTERESLAIGIVNIEDHELRERITKRETYDQEIIHTDNLILIQ